MKRFERKITAQGLETVKGPSLDPAGESRGGVQVIRGGVLKAKDRGHKDWGHTIHKNFELRNQLKTAEYHELTDATTTFALEPGVDCIIRMPDIAASALEFAIYAPQGVPTDQHTQTGKYRGRVWESTVVVYSPEINNIILPGNLKVEKRTAYYLQGRVDGPNFETDHTDYELHKEDYWTDLDGNVQEDASFSPPIVHKIPYGAGTAEVFHVTYIERTGDAYITPLFTGVAMTDPETVNPGGTEPNEPTTEGPADGGTPWNPGGGEDGESSDETGYPSDLNPTAPSTSTDNDYDRPVELPTETSGTLYALHAEGFSYSPNGGANWVYRKIQSNGAFIDMVVNETYGIWLLTAAGEVFHAVDRVSGFAKLDFSAIYETGDLSIGLQNPGFETGDLTGWDTVSSFSPNVVDTTAPPQRPDSQHYLTRNPIFGGGFVIEQTVDLTDYDKQSGLEVSGWVYETGADNAIIQLIDEIEVADAVGSSSLSLSGNGKEGSIFTANNFAQTPDGEPLNLIGEVTEVISSTQWAIESEFDLGFRIGNYNANYNDYLHGRIKFTVQRSDGSLYDGRIRMRIFDLDTATPLGSFTENEKLRFLYGLVRYDLSGSNVTFDGYQFQGVSYSTSNEETTAIGVVVESTFEVQFRADTQGAFGFREIGYADPGSHILAETDPPSGINRWERLTAAVKPGVQLPDAVKVRLIGQDVDNGGAVYFDNIGLAIPGAAEVPPVDEIAWSQRGCDIYMHDILFIPGINPEVEETQTTGVAKAQSDGLFKIAYDGTQTLIKPIEGQEWETAIAGQAVDISAGYYALALMSDGTLNIIDKMTGAVTADPLSPGSGGLIASDRLRQGAVFTTVATGYMVFYKDGLFATWGEQPVSATATQRQTVCLDIGRYFGWNVGSRDIYWTDNPNTAWKLGGAIYKPIIKIVVAR